MIAADAYLRPHAAGLIMLKLGETLIRTLPSALSAPTGHSICPIPRTVSRCGGQAEPGSTEFLDWQIAENNAVICPRCLTPLDHTEHGEARSLTEYRDDEVLRELDPDNDDHC
jgi:hypothetical protein